METKDVTWFLERQADRGPPSADWKVQIKRQDLTPCNYTGFGGWGDRRDQRLCLHFAGIAESR